MSLVTCQNGLLFLVNVCRFLVVVSSNTLAGNGLGIAEVGVFENSQSKYSKKAD
jgi:hypothetical protein